jgi:phosphoserine phosphatase RsbU/P
MVPAPFFSFLHPRSLRQRIALFILVPTFCILTAIGAAGFFVVRDLLLEQWGEAAIAKLQRAAHEIDMGLGRPKQLLSLLQETAGYGVADRIQPFVIEQLRQMEGVVDVKIDWPDSLSNLAEMPTGEGRMSGQGHHGMRQTAVNPPLFDFSSQNKLVSLAMEFIDSTGEKVGGVEVLLSFDALVATTTQAPIWNIYKAYIVDMQGNILSRTILQSTGAVRQDATTFGSEGELETKTLAALQQHNAGTVFGPGMPPKEISGFYRLEEAPWTLILIAPAGEVLQPILRFRSIYLAGSIISIFLILWFIRVMTAKTTRAIKELSLAAGNLAQGNFGTPLKVTTQDEVGDLTRTFNTMTSQLEHGAHLQKSMEIAREVQQNFLPQKSLVRPGLEVSGLSLYCDETGGDFFDIIEYPGNVGQVDVAVGDVVGHGIGAALLMATIRALVRSRVDQPGTLAEKIADVNRLLCADTVQSANFASLLYLGIDAIGRELQWVRAGHDPPFLYYPRLHQHGELRGEGLVLGFDPAYPYSVNALAVGSEELIILIGSDGAWEIENTQGEQFGKQRIKDLLAEYWQLTPAHLLQALTQEIEQFRGSHPQEDDITLVAVKIAPLPHACS